MSKAWLMVLFIISIHHSIDGSYEYAGCYTQVFYESFFSSSFMEPTLCFRLCDTPIIYLQKTICRCSGGGLMHHNKQPDGSCSFPCTKPVDRQVKTVNTCGGQQTYSAYVEQSFYVRHGHLLSYQINFFACELWRTNDIYETIRVDMNSIPGTSSLNKLERCAAVCLDKNVTTKSIAFNDDNNQCLCIMPWKWNTATQRLNYIGILPNTSCDRYCDNTPDDSNADHKFQCGSLNNTRIWAVYDLNGTCPTDYVYIKEFKKCLHTYKNFWNSCTPPAKSYVFDDTNTWQDFLKMINILKLNQTLVTVDFDEDVVVNSSWKCPKTASDTTSSYSSYSSYYSWNSNTRFILDNGCLRDSSYTTYAHRYSNRLCIANPLNKYSLAIDDEANSTYIALATPILKFCPTNWFDLNGRCYRMSDEKKSMRNARNSCITISESQTNKTSKSHPWTSDDDDDDDFDSYSGLGGDYFVDDQLDDSPKGEVVQYTSEWQVRLGFFLLDTIPDTAVPPSNTLPTSNNLYYDDLISIGSTAAVYQGDINEFQMSNPNENKTASMTDDSCMISNRKSVEQTERPAVAINWQNNCSTPNHVLCETNTLIVRDFQQGCFRKPLILDLPAMVSNRLTYELCLSVCKELQTKLAILHINKCYCSPVISKAFNLTGNLATYQKKNCGNPCSGNRHERCGDDETIVVFQILDSRRSLTEISTPVQPYPDFIYDSCVQISLNSSTTYQFNLKDLHPRNCLELCTNNQQQYALINGNKCFCTNVQVKMDQSTTLLAHYDCSLKCSGNYFYTCGNNDDSTKYSMYIMKPRCIHGYEVADNDLQCVYTHLSVKKKSFSDAESYCKSIGGQIAVINDILEIQNVLPDSISGSGLLKTYPFYYYMKSLHNTKYFWVNRTSVTTDENNTTIISAPLPKCSQVSEIIDKNCLVIHHEPHVTFSRFNITVARLCIAESNQCSNVSAMPICVDQHLEPKPTLVSPSTTAISSTVTRSYSCDHPDYHFIDNYCYRIIFHEHSWNDAKAKCKEDSAMLFVPEKSTTLHMIKSLFLHRSSYTSSGFAHVGVTYDYPNHTVIQYTAGDENDPQTVPDSNVVYDLCEKTFLDRYNALMAPTGLSTNERNRLKQQRIGCGYVDLLSYTVPVVRCDEMPCNRTATVICQKVPVVETNVLTVERGVFITPTDDSPNNETSVINVQESTKSIGRDFAPIFFILATIFALILLGSISTLYNHRFYQKNNNRRNNNSVYSPLTSPNEFDLS